MRIRFLMRSCSLGGILRQDNRINRISIHSVVVWNVVNLESPANPVKGSLGRVSGYLGAGQRGIPSVPSTTGCDFC